MIYFDSSALVKRYVEEYGSNNVNSVLANAAIVATSKLTYPEILSAFTRKHKEGEISTVSSFKFIPHTVSGLFPTFFLC